MRWVEVLCARGDVGTAREWIAEIALGIFDEGALVDISTRTGTTFDEVWEVFRSTVFRNGKRVILPETRCTLFWDALRPCILAEGHAGDHEPQDVPIDRQYENLRAFEGEFGRVIASVALAEQGRQ